MNYQGGKVKYSKYIIPILQDAIDKSGYTTFIDGCCGGCNIIDKINCQNKIAIDNNEYLIELFKHIVECGTDFITEEAPTKEIWDKVKANKEDYPKWYVGYIEHLCSFNSRGWIGGYGVKSKDRYQYGERRNGVIRQAPLLKDIKFIAGDVNELDANKCVIYFDPPYDGTKKYDSLVNNPFDYNKFWNTVRRLSSSNFVFVSEARAPDDFIPIWTLETKRNIRGNTYTATENLFVYKENNNGL